MIPPRVAAFGASLAGRLVLAITALALLWFMGAKLYSIPYEAGQASTQAKWDASIERGRAEVERLKADASKVTVKVETKYIDRVRVVREKADAIETVREVFVPVDSGVLPGGFRLYFDGAVTNTIPNPADIADAAPVPIADVADTHASNAARCHIAYETVEGWQDWAREQQALNP